jgi:hypothetical protein
MVPEQGDGLWADIQRHRARGNVDSVHSFGLRRLRELARYQMVHRQQDLHARALRLGEEGARGRGEVVLHQGGAHGAPLRLEERVGHAAGDDHRVDTGKERFQYCDLRRNLGAADDRDKGLGRVLEHAPEELDLFFHQEAGHARKDPRHPLGRSVRPMRGAEGVVDVHVTE